MAIASHIAELSDKHRILDAQIREEMARPSPDSLMVTGLKRQKLRIKDELARLSAEPSIRASV